MENVDIIVKHEEPEWAKCLEMTGQKLTIKLYPK